MIKNKIFRFTLLVVIGLAIAGSIAYVQISSDASKKQKSVVASDFGGPLHLVDQNGKIFTDKDFEAGQYRLIYFGFTYCPAICPTELQRMNTVLKDLGDKGEKITPYFITVDPERDNVDVIKNYISLFHPRMIGLTGTLAQIEEAKKSYKIYAAKIKDETMSDYTMDHSSYIYFINPDNDLLRIFKANDSTEDMVNTIEQYIE
ncbi:MAG: SCO family protein [Alphaproteobacteria bacterium]|nr:SCO family protein [Alphaproteobacteria bacterium]